VDEKKSLAEIEIIKEKVKHELEHLNIQHATLEVEPAVENLRSKDC
jgi:hypothetical protein